MARFKVGTPVTITDSASVPTSLRKWFVAGETAGTVTKQVPPTGISGYGYSCEVEWGIAGSWGDTITKRHDESALTALEVR